MYQFKLPKVYHFKMPLTSVKNFDVYFVKVDCNKKIRNEREALRNDRFIGLSDIQDEKIDKFVEYDLKIDTSFLSPEENAKNIKIFIENGSNSALSEMTIRYDN